MTNQKWIGLLLCAVMVFSVCSGCADNGKVQENETSGTLSNPVIVDDSGMAEGELQVSSDGVTDVSSGEGDETADSTASESDGAGTVPTAMDQTETKFKAEFDGNPIDKAQAGKEENAETNLEMREISGEFLEIWEAEAVIADKKAKRALTGAALSDYTQNQQDWENSREAKLEQIQKDVAENFGDGSGYALALSQQTTAFYRARVYAIYLILYRANGTLPALSYKSTQG